jgi:hypothetical protein
MVRNIVAGDEPFVTIGYAGGSRIINAAVQRPHDEGAGAVGARAVHPCWAAPARL